MLIECVIATIVCFLVSILFSKIGERKKADWFLYVGCVGLVATICCFLE